MKFEYKPEPNRAFKELTVDETFELFIASRHKCSEGSKAYYRYFGSRFISYCKLIGIKNISEVSAHVVNSFFNEMASRNCINGLENPDNLDYFDRENKKGEPLSGAYLNAYGRVIRTMLNYCFWMNYITVEVKFLLPKIPEVELLYFTNETVAKMLTAIDDYVIPFLRERDEMLILFSIDSGFREFEVSKANRDDIDLRNGQIKVQGKMDKFAIIAIGKELISMLGNYFHKHDEFLKKLEERGFSVDHKALFITRTGTRLQTRSINSVYVRLAKKLGSKISSHGFRRTCARNMILAGKSIFDVQTQLRHENIQQTKDYIKNLTPEYHTVQVQQGLGSAADALIRTTRKPKAKLKRNIRTKEPKQPVMTPQI